MDELLLKIESMLPEFTLAQRQVAAFILENYREIPFLSVTAMAKQIGVSDTTIIKLCVNLGFSGFSSFKRMVSEHVLSEMTMDGRLEGQLREIGEGNMLDRVLAYDISNLQSTFENPQNRQNFDRLITSIEEAKNIYVMGFRTSAILAEFMYLHLRQQNYHIETITPGLGEYADKLCQIQKDDLCVVITFTRYSADVCQGMEMLKKRGIPCALITDSLLCPCYSIADNVLLCETKTFHHALSYVSFFSLMNAIITATSLNRTEQTKQHFKQLEELFSTFNTFYS